MREAIDMLTSLYIELEEVQRAGITTPRKISELYRKLREVRLRLTALQLRQLENQPQQP